MARPTHIGNPTYGAPSVVISVGDDPDAPIGDVPTPEDAAPGSKVDIPVSGERTFALVQEHEHANTTSDATIAITFDPAPVEGDLLVVTYVVRENGTIDPTLSGWTPLPDSDGVSMTDGAGGDNGGVYLFWKLAGSSEPATVTITKNQSKSAWMAAAEFSGDWTFEASNSESSTSLVSSLGSGSITPAGSRALMVGVIAQTNESVFTIGGGFTEVHQGRTGGGAGPTGILGWRYEETPAGSYEMTATSDKSDSYGGIIASFEPAAGDPVTWIPGSLTKDEDDATFEYVSEESAIDGGAVLRLDVGTAQRFASFRLVIGTEDAGSVEYTLEASNSEDFTGAVELVSVTFAATGSFTADTVTASWSQSTGYRYYRLVPTTPDDVRIYTFSLYPPPDPADHVIDTTDAHAASAISYDPTTSGLTATDVQAALDELEAAITPGVTDHGALTGLADDDHEQYVPITTGAVRYLDHGAAGATETVDLAAANVHRLTLDANCTITLTGAVATRGGSPASCSVVVELLQDGTGGWDVVWPGSVDFGSADDQPDQTADVMSVFSLYTNDGGTTWIGFPVGGGGGGGATALDDLTDVVITTPAANHTLRYIGGQWVNDDRRWEPVTFNFGTGPELVWDGDDLVMEWKGY